MDAFPGMTWEHSSLITECIITPLLQKPEFVEFFPMIQETEYALDLAQLRSIRDVEVMLIARCHVSFLEFAHCCIGVNRP